MTSNKMIRNNLGFILQILALLVSCMIAYFVISSANDATEGIRINRYIEKMEAHHENLVEFANSYISIITKETYEEGPAAALRKRLRDTLARLRQNMNNWGELLDDESRATVGPYISALYRLDNALADGDNADVFIQAFLDFKRKRDCVAREVNRQFFDIEESDSQCQKEE